MEFVRIIASFVLAASSVLSVIALFALSLNVAHPFAPFTSFSVTEFVTLAVMAFLVQAVMQEMSVETAE